MPETAFREFDVQASQDHKVLIMKRRPPLTQPDGFNFTIDASQFMLPEPEPIEVVVGADFAEPKTIQDLADEQRQFLATIQEPLEDVKLPPDND